MITLGQIDSYLIFLTISALAVWLEHMAFRTGPWPRRELARRAIGTETVLILFLLIVVTAGDADWLTWLMLQAAFIVAGCIKFILAYVDRAKRRELTGVLNERTNETPVS